MKPHPHPAMWAAALLCCHLTTPANAAGTSPALDFTRATFGKLPDGRTVEVFTLTNTRGTSVKVMSLGATLISVQTPDRNGRTDEITLNLDSLEAYVAGHPSLGSTVGRFANRIGQAQFVIDGKTHQVTPNAKPHHIHGGREGFGKLLWNARTQKDRDSVQVEFSLTSPDGDEGYPGTLTARAIYRLNEKNELTMEYFAETDKATHVNLTNHAYWNLSGAGSGTVHDHLLMLNAKHSLAIDDKKIPTGELSPVKNTPLDFTKSMRIGERIKEVGGGGYDHCYAIDHRKPGSLTLAARVEDPKTGRIMEVLTTQPGVQLYTANYLSEKTGARGRNYGPHHALCLEAQAFPDAPNKPEFPSSLLRPGQTYHQVTVHRFSVKR